MQRVQRYWVKCLGLLFLTCTRSHSKGPLSHESLFGSAEADTHMEEFAAFTVLDSGIFLALPKFYSLLNIYSHLTMFTSWRKEKKLVKNCYVDLGQHIIIMYHINKTWRQCCYSLSLKDTSTFLITQPSHCTVCFHLYQARGPPCIACGCHCLSVRLPTESTRIRTWFLSMLRTSDILLLMLRILLFSGLILAA